MEEVTVEFYRQLNEQYAVNKADYSKPIRLYTDIDGVLYPYMYTDEIDPNYNYVESLIPTIRPTYEMGEQKFLVGDSKIVYRPEVLAKYQEWGNHPLVDLVFLTSWNMNAVRGIAETLEIPNLGYLKWQPLGMSDYTQRGKRKAIKKDQKKYPSSFIWLEDKANQPTPLWDEEGENIIGVESLFIEYREDIDWEERRKPSNQTIIPTDRYLSVQPESSQGLTDEHLTEVDEWIANYQNQLTQ